MSKKKTINTAKEAVDVAKDLITDKHKEHFIALYLNPHNQLNKTEIVSIGTINACLVHPREVFRPAIISHSASLVVLHNHPSGSVEPSEADLELTKRLKKAGEILGYEIADHIVFDSCCKYNSLIK